MHAFVIEAIKAIHKHPGFSLFLACVMCAYMYFSMNYFAVASEVENINKTMEQQIAKNDKDITEVKGLLRRNHLEQKVRSLESDVMSWERVVKLPDGDTEQNHRWLRRLRTELNAAQRALSRLDGGII